MMQGGLSRQEDKKTERTTACIENTRGGALVTMTIDRVQASMLAATVMVGSIIIAESTANFIKKTCAGQVVMVTTTKTTASAVEACNDRTVVTTGTNASAIKVNKTAMVETTGKFPASRIVKAVVKIAGCIPRTVTHDAADDLPHRAPGTIVTTKTTLASRRSHPICASAHGHRGSN